VLNAVLRPYGLTAHDGGLIPGIQIATLSGSQAIVDDLEAVWVAVDPLDARFVGTGSEAP
jgi:hypothetical protein